MYKYNILLCLCFLYVTITRCQNVGQPACDRQRNVTHAFVCTLVNKCGHLREIFRKGVPIPCGFEGKIQKICCPRRLTVASQNPPRKTAGASLGPTREKNPYRIAWNKYSAARLINGTDPDGKPFSVPDCEYIRFIYLGQSTKPMEFPHMALIGYETQNRGQINWSCGGSLISERYVLSAAHCSVSSSGEAKWVRLGELIVDSESDGFHHRDYSIVRRFVHPQYKPPQVYNDIVLFKLNTTVIFNSYIRPICLYNSTTLPPFLKNRVVITGWGATGAGEQGSAALQKATINFLRDDVCKPIYEKDVEQFRNGYHDKSMICAGDTINGTDTCGGDSGGPIQFEIANVSCMWSQVGITSIGSVFCGGKLPAIYTEVAYYIPWIQKIVWP